MRLELDCRDQPALGAWSATAHLHGLILPLRDGPVVDRGAVPRFILSVLVMVFSTPRTVSSLLSSSPRPPIVLHLGHPISQTSLFRLSLQQASELSCNLLALAIVPNNHKQYMQNSIYWNSGETVDINESAAGSASPLWVELWAVHISRCSMFVRARSSCLLKHLALRTCSVSSPS